MPTNLSLTRGMRVETWLVLPIRDTEKGCLPEAFGTNRPSRATGRQPHPNKVAAASQRTPGRHAPLLRCTSAPSLSEKLSGPSPTRITPACRLHLSANRCPSNSEFRVHQR